MAENSIAKAYVQVIPSAKGVGSKLSSIFGKEMPSAGNSAGGIFGSNLVSKVSGLVAAAGFGKMLSDAISAGADMQQSLGGIETLFKDSADLVVQNAEKAYATAGMSANQYMETVTGFSASLLQGLAGDTEKASSLADMALTDMSDNANKMGTDMELIKNAYQGFAKQNYTMLDNLKLGYGGTKTEMERLLADAQELTGVKYDISNLADVYSAIHVIQEEMGITGTTAKEASSTISGSLSSLKAAFSDVLANLALGRELDGSLQALTDSAFTFFAGNLLPAAGSVLKGLPTVLSTAFSAAIRGLNLASANSGQLVKNGVELVKSIGNSVITAAPHLLKAGVSLVSSIGEAVLETDWIELGTGAVEAIKESISVAAFEILGTDQNIVQSIMSAVSAGGLQLWETGGSMVSQIVSGLFSALPGLLSAGLDLSVSFVGVLLGQLPAILSAGTNILLSVVDGIRQSIPDIGASAGDAVGEMLSTIVDNLPEIINAGFDMVVSLIEGIGDAGPDIIEAASDIAGKVWDAVLETDWIQLGKDIINGLIKGIGAMGDALWDAAKTVASSALDAIKEFFGIASPSKVMRDEVGKWIPPGIAVGVEANTKPLTDAMHEVSALTTHTLEADLSVDKLSRTAPAVTSGGSTSIVINVYAEKGQSVEELADILFSRLNSMISRKEAALAF